MAAYAPRAMVSLPAMMPLMFGCACRMVWVLLQRLGLVPVRALLGDHLQVRVLVEHAVVALRPDARVGVGGLAGQLGVLALAAHHLGELLAAEAGALGVVGDDLGDRDAGLVDLPVDQEGRDLGVLGPLDGGHRGVRARVVQDDRGGLAGDRGVDLLALLGRVVVVAEHQRLVAELLGLGVGGVLLGLEEDVVRRRRDDHDQLRGGGLSRGRLAGGVAATAARPG